MLLSSRLLRAQKQGKNTTETVSEEGECHLMEETVFECLFSDSRGLRELIEGFLKLWQPPKLTVERTRKDLFACECLPQLAAVTQVYVKGAESPQSELAC